MRALAVFALLLLQEPDVESLLKQLEDESIEEREKAALSLIELGVPPSRLLKNGLRAP